MLCAVGWQLGCGSATADDETDDGSSDVRDVPDETPVDVPDEDGETCAPGLTDCGGACVDLDGDPDHCGTCDTGCLPGDNAEAICVSRVCGLRCEPGWVDLDGLPGCEMECTPSVPPTEACDGVDNNCDGETDNGAGFECVLGATGPCTTSCDTSGERSCPDTCLWSECAPPPETCDGVDQDCNGVVDDGMYDVVWTVEPVAVAAGSSVLDFSVAVAAGEVGLGHVLATSASATTGQARLLRARLTDGSSPGGVVSLGTGSAAQTMNAAAAGTIASFVWNTSDGSTPRGESALIRSGILGSAYVLGSSTALDSSDEELSGPPATVRSTAHDLAFCAWAESPTGTPALQLAVVENRVAPSVAASLNLGGGVNPRDPSIALHADHTLLVVWAAGSPGEIRGQRLDLGLVPQGVVFELNSSPTVASERPRTVASAERFAVVWEEGGARVMLTILDPDGAVFLPPAEIGPGGASLPVIAPDLNGGFAVAYQTATDVELIRISADGIPRGEPLVFAGAQHPEIAAIPEGGLIIAYLAAGTVRLARIGCGS